MQVVEPRDGGLSFFKFITDVDDDDSPSFADVASTPGTGGYGDFVLTSGTWTYTLDQSAVQSLDAGDMVTDTITVTATDGTTQQITVTITGTADTSVVTGVVTGAVLEGNIGDTVTATGNLVITDDDDDDTPSFADVASTPGTGGYGDFVLTSGTWTYTLDQSAVQNLDAGDLVNGRVGQISGATLRIEGDVLRRLTTTSSADLLDLNGLDDGALDLINPPGGDDGLLEIVNLTDPKRVRTR